MKRVKKVEIVCSDIQSNEIFDVIIDGYRHDIVGVDALYRCLDEIFKPKQEECLHLDEFLIPCGVGEITSVWDERFKSN